jgi:hypothetical protein
MVGKVIDRYTKLSTPVKMSFWLLVCSFLQKGIGMITTPIFTRIMTPEEYGSYSVFTSWQGIFLVFVSLNLCAGCFTRGLVKYEDERPQFVSSFQGLSFTLTQWDSTGGRAKYFRCSLVSSNIGKHSFHLGRPAGTFYALP